MTGAAACLYADGTPVAEYVWAPDLPTGLAPRPYLHPVRTLRGTVVTELRPADHQHHLGASVAVPDLSGHNFWGGRTFVRASGPTDRGDHGVQRHDRWLSRSPDELVAGLSWLGRDGTVLIRERRRIAVLPAGPDRWALDMEFELANVTPSPLVFASPATNGRPGAGYGGFFWRAPRPPAGVVVFGPDRRGVRHLHGRRSRWLALAGADGRQPAWTLLFVPVGAGPAGDPWFVRTRDYAGVGSCLAWDRPLVLVSGDTVRRRIITVVADGVLATDRAARVADEVAARVAGAPPAGDVGVVRG
nr:PmoA family protein [Micromonospora sp. DSM 115978]